MALSIFVIFFLATLGALIAVLIDEMVRTVLSFWRCNKKLGAIPMASNFSPLGGHLRSSFMAPLLPKAIRRLHQTYGKYVGFMLGPQLMVTTTDLELINQIAVIEGQTHVNREAPIIPISELVSDSIILARDDQWRRIRRAFAPALRGANLKTPNVTDEIRCCIEKFVGALEYRLAAAADASKRRADIESEVTKEQRDEKQQQQQVEVEIDMDNMAHRYSLDLTLTCLYKQKNIVDFRADRDRLVDTVDEGLRALATSKIIKLCACIPALQPVIDWFIWNFHPQGAWRKEVMEFVKLQAKRGLEARAKLAQHTKAAESQSASSGKESVDEENFLLEDGSKFSRNMSDYIIDRYCEGKLTWREYLHSSCFFLNAADKTTADVVMHTLYQLGLNQRAQDKLVAAIKTDGPKAEYLAWVLNESLRLFSPVGFGCARQVKRDFHVEGGIIPAGTLVVPHLGTIHRLPEYWGEDADEFKPERFAREAEFHPMQFMPFGAGIRGCPGKEFALHGLKLLLCALLPRFKFECEPKKNTDYDAPLLIITVQHEAARIRISHRR